jgi:S-adenosylmethionine decarboxylase
MIYNGKHLTVDAVLLDPSFNDRLVLSQYGAQVMDRIVREIDMTLILPPITCNFPHAVSEMDRILQALEKEGLASSGTATMIRHNLQCRVEQTFGYSTIAMIAESHLSIHTFPESNFFSFDAYSCKDFDHATVIRILESVFGPLQSHVNILARLVPRVNPQ